MKTKHILTALALPAMFAACTAEDIVSENNALQQDARAKLSKDFVLNINNGAESRYAVVSDGAGLKFDYEEGDLIGANLIDIYQPEKEDAKYWDITPYVAPSLPFKNNGANQWKSDAELGVGNYLFTYPFNAKDNGRGAAQFELPRVQKYTSADANAIVEENNKAVGAVVLYEGQTEANAALKNLYTYPKFIINFDNGVEVKKVTKVILQKGGNTLENGFVYKGGIHHEAVANMFKGLEAYVKAQVKLGLTKEEAEVNYWAQFQTSDFIIDGKVNHLGYTNNLEPAGLDAYGKPAYTNYLVVEMDEAVKANAVTDNKSVEVRLMMPSIADLSQVNDLKMHVVTDNGTYELPINLSISGTQISSTGLVFKSDNIAKVKAALSRSSANTLRTIDITKANKGSDLGNIVTTAADWNALVEAKKAASTQITVNVLDSEFALTKDLKMPENELGFKIESPIAVEGEVTLSKIEASEVIVKKDAVLNTSGSFSAAKVTVEEEGNLVFAKVLDTNNKLVDYIGVTTVENKGQVTVKAGAKASFTLNNAKGAELNVEAAASRAAGDAEVDLKGTNNGYILNEGIINAENGFVNQIPSEVAGYEWDATANAWDGVPTIENKGTFNAMATIYNYGLFKNAGKLTSDFSNSTKFYNNMKSGQTASKAYKATLEIAAGATTFIDNNTNAVIVLAEAAPANFTIYEAKNKANYQATSSSDVTYLKRGTIKYTATSKETSLENSPVNYLIANGGVDLTKTFTYTAEGASSATVCTLPTLEVNGGTVKIAANTATTSVAKVANLIIKGEATIDGTINSVAKITVSPDATLSVPVAAKLQVGDDTSFEFPAADATEGEVAGKVFVNGALHYASVETASKETTTSWSNIVLGKGVKISCEEETEDTPTAEETKLATTTTKALTAFLEAWFANVPVANFESIADSWSDLVGTDAEPAEILLTYDWDAEVQVVNWANPSIIAFNKAFTDAGYETEEIPSINETLEDEATQVKTILGTIKSNVDLTEAITGGNTWFNVVYVKTASDLADKNIHALNTPANTMYTAWTTLFAGKTHAQLGNAAWLTWNDLKNAKNDKNESLYPENIYTYIPEYSYVEAYETSELYKAVKLWITLSTKYTEITTGKFNAAVVKFDDMVKYFNEVYKNKQDGPLKNDVFFTEDAALVDATYVKTVAGWDYIDAQIGVIANMMGNDFGLTVTVPTIPTTPAN